MDRTPGEPDVGADADEIARLRAEARYHRERLDLYRARAYGPRATSPTKLRELERAHDGAEERLRHALRERERES